MMNRKMPIIALAIGLAVIVCGLLILGKVASKQDSRPVSNAHRARVKGDEQRQQATFYMQELKRLEKRKVLTTADLAKAHQMVDWLTERYGDLGIRIREPAWPSHASTRTAQESRAMAAVKRTAQESRAVAAVRRTMGNWPAKQWRTRPVEEGVAVLAGQSAAYWVGPGEKVFAVTKAAFYWSPGLDWLPDDVDRDAINRVLQNLSTNE